MWQLMIEFRNGGAILLRSNRETILVWVGQVQETDVWSSLRVFDEVGTLQDAKGAMLV